MRFQFSAYLSRGAGAHWFSAMKATLNMIGPPVGDPQPPLAPLEATHYGKLIEMLTELGYATHSVSA